MDMGDCAIDRFPFKTTKIRKPLQKDTPKPAIPEFGLLKGTWRGASVEALGAMRMHTCWKEKHPMDGQHPRQSPVGTTSPNIHTASSIPLQLVSKYHPEYSQLVSTDLSQMRSRCCLSKDSSHKQAKRATRASIRISCRPTDEKTS